MKGGTAEQLTIEEHLARGKARRTDPETSHLAAHTIVKSGELGRQQAQVLELVARHCKMRGLTSYELAGTDVALRYRIARRLPELARLGLVLRGPARVCGITGRQASTWRVRKD